MLVVGSVGVVVEVVFVLVLIDVVVDTGSAVVDVTVTGASTVGTVVVVVVVVVVGAIVIGAAVVVVVGTTLRLVIALACTAVTFEPIPN